MVSQMKPGGHISVYATVCSQFLGNISISSTSVSNFLTPPSLPHSSSFTHTPMLKATTNRGYTRLKVKGELVRSNDVCRFERNVYKVTLQVG